MSPLVKGMVALLALLPTMAQAQKPRAMFALIVGVNESMDPDQEPLRYADDDGALYFRLFRSIGAQTYLLTKMDGNTRRVHPQAAAEAREPTARWFHEALSKVADDVELARQREVETAFYFVYAGHGKVHRGQGAVSLEDMWLQSKHLLDMVEQVGADTNHIIVDACYSYFLAFTRGPGGKRRDIKGFSEMKDAFADRDNVGLLLSTASEDKSHEWEGIQAGVFSHEIRSGLHGTADADGDGLVSYREIAAFVDKANATIPNERFRPKLYARQPNNSYILMDLNAPLQRRLEIQGTEEGHYFLEDSRGLRLVDFHNARGQRVSVLRAPTSTPLYLHKVGEETEYVIPPEPEIVHLSSLEPQEPQTRTRDASHDAFTLLFQEPFDRQAVEQFDFSEQIERREAPPTKATPTVPWRTYAGWSAVGSSILVAGVGMVVGLWSLKMGNEATPISSQMDILELNDRIDTFNTASIALEGAAAGLLATGLFLLLWPERPAGVSVGGSNGSGAFTFSGAF